MTIKNNDDFAWTEVSLEMNEIYRYAGKIAQVVSHSSITVRLSDFVEPNGNRFDIKTTEPLKIVVKAKEGAYQGQWQAAIVTPSP